MTFPFIESGHKVSQLSSNARYMATVHSLKSSYPENYSKKLNLVSSQDKDGQGLKGDPNSSEEQQGKGNAVARKDDHV